MKNQKILVGLFLVCILSLPLICHADATFLTNIINKIVTDAGLILITLCTLMIIYAGVTMLLSAGSPEKVSTSRSILLWSAVGLVVGLSATAISAMIGAWAK